jgi:mevalonate kinase
MKQISCKACGKIILTGEYSVLYNKPALAISTTQQATCEIKEIKQNYTSINLQNLNKKANFLLNEVSLDKEFNIVLTIIKQIINKYNINIHSIEISINSSLQMSSGLGSSAAFIVSITHALFEYYNLNKNYETLFQICIETESLLHKTSSGLDVAASLSGKGIFYQNKQIIANFNFPFKFFLINTGTPSSFTHQCVEKVMQQFQNSSIWNNFEKVSLEIYQSILTNDKLNFLKNINHNQKLLEDLGVVPKKVATFINQLQTFNAAAKITGAGSISGENGGIVIVFNIDKTTLQDLCKQYQYFLYE